MTRILLKGVRQPFDVKEDLEHVMAEIERADGSLRRWGTTDPGRWSVFTLVTDEALVIDPHEFAGVTG